MRVSMAAFFSSQLDFIFFFYGLAFILLGVTCFAIARIRNSTEAWALLGLFGCAHGAGEWLDLTALVIGDTPIFALGRTALMAVSFLFLMEFARQQAIRFGLKLPGSWLYVPLIILVLLSGVSGGLNSAGAFARYIFGFVGAMATSLVFVWYARGFSGINRRLAIFTAMGFAVYAVAAGVIVPAAPFWPANSINYGWFAQLTGMPIQLVRGTLACWMAFSIWAIWGLQLISDVASARYTSYMRQQFIWTLAAMAAILVFGWVLTEFLGGIYKQNVQAEARGDIELLASRLSGETATVEGMVRSLAGSPSVLPLLIGGSRKETELAKTVLDLDVQASGAKLGFILNISGRVVASSDGRENSPSGAPNYLSTPYFQKSIAGDASYHFEFDAATRGPYYFASYPVRYNSGAIIGVAVLKKSLEVFEMDIKEFDRPYFFTDPDGIVVMTNRPTMLFRTLWPLSRERKTLLVQQFGELNDRPMLEREITNAIWANVDGERDYVRRRYVNQSKWSLVILKPTREIFASRVLGIVITLLITIMTLIYLFGKERWVHDSIQMEKRLKLQELARDLGFRATTDPLTGLFNRLKFDEVLANEMLRAKRYKTPLSLILYDVDHFKKINDAFGHQIGDKVLTQLSQLMSSQIRSTDLIARWGGEEFVILIPNSEGQMAYQTAEKLRETIVKFSIEPVGAVTCSFGVAQFADGDSAETFIARADDALYHAKVNGRNRVEIASLPEVASPNLASVA